MNACIPSVGLILILMSGSTQAENLYAPDTFKPLITDQRAYRAGDALTVLVLENSSAFTSADTDLGRSTDISAAVSTSTGIASSLNGATINFGNTSEGMGQTSRAGRLQAQITVSVTAVEPNGDLRISGTKVIEVNREKQMFQITGKVRREDISNDNTISSNRLADVNIAFTGDGDISQKQRPGLISRILDWMSIL